MLFIIALLVSLRSHTELGQVLSRWDVEHFLAIAEYGYERLPPQEMAFFPGLPLMLKAGSLLGIPMIGVGVVLSLVTSALATWALYRLGGRWAAIAWLLAPTSVFTLVPYSESPFCAAAFWAWERATKGKWGAASACAALACTLRVSGLFLVGALGVLALVQAWKRRSASDLLTTVPWLLTPLGVLFAYAAYLHSLTGTWMAWYSAQSTGWMREFTLPWEALAHHWKAVQPGMYADHPGWVWIFRAELVSMVVGVVVTLVCLYRRRLAEASWVAVQVLAFSLSYWFQSVCRAVLLWFPLWTLTGEFVGRRTTGVWRWVWAVVVVVALAVQAVWAVLFYKEMWAS